MHKTLDALSDDMIVISGKLKAAQTSEAPAIDLLIIQVALLDALSALAHHQKKFVKE